MVGGLGGQGLRGLRRFERQLPAALQGLGALGLRGGVAPQQVGVLGSQPREVEALAADLLLQHRDLLLCLFQLGLPLLDLPGQARLRRPLAGDLPAGRQVPAPQQYGAGDRGRRGHGDEDAQRYRVVPVPEQPGAAGADERQGAESGRNQHFVQC